MKETIKLVLLLSCVIDNFLFCQNNIIQEVKLDNGKTVILYSDGTWKEKLQANPKIAKPKIEWVTIKGGTFIMGSPENEENRSSEELQHKVTLKSFKMSKYEITFEQYDAFCEAVGREKPKDEGWGRGKRPVINVSWDDANEFAKWIGGRLPTEAEWEYACRAGTNTPYNTGNELTLTQANFYGDSAKTFPVGSFKPNAWGLYDMHGNVAEWCSDWHDYYSPDPQENPKGPETGSWKIIRGGSWYDYNYNCRCAYRYYYSPETRYNFIGFRIVMDE